MFEKDAREVNKGNTYRAFQPTLVIKFMLVKHRSRYANRNY